MQTITCVCVHTRGKLIGACPWLALVTCIPSQQHSMKRGREGADDGADDSKHRRLDTDAAPAGGGGARAAEASSARSAEPAADEPSGGQREPLSQASRGAGVDATGVAPAGELQGARDAPAEPSDGGGADEGAVPGSGTHPVPGQAEEEEDEDLDAPVMPQPQRMRVRKGTECPYLDTISRQVLPITSPLSQPRTRPAAIAAIPYLCLRCAAAELSVCREQ